MNRKTLWLFILIIILLCSACTYNRSLPPAESPAPRPRQEKQQGPSAPKPSPKHQEETDDSLSKSDKEAVEENINGFDISEDEAITKQAESLMMTQIHTAVDQTEISQLTEAQDKSTENDILVIYDKKLPPEIIYDVKYEKYNLTYDYFLVTSEDEVNIFKNPDPDDAVVCTAGQYEKLALHQQVSGKTFGDSDIWYKVSCKHDGDIVTGYIHSSSGVNRTFQFDKMLSALQDLQQQLAQGKLNHISNYKNANGAPPKKGEGATDEYGMRIYQSAPGYFQPDTSSDFRYIPDGMLVRILDQTDEFYRVAVDSFNQELYVPKNYIDPTML